MNVIVRESDDDQGFASWVIECHKCEQTTFIYRFTDDYNKTPEFCPRCGSQITEIEMDEP